MKLHYDPEADALYLRLVDAPIVDTEEVRPGLMLDFDAKNRVVGVEVLNVRRHLPEAEVRRLQLEVAS